jgi:hypothetical protein
MQRLEVYKKNWKIAKIQVDVCRLLVELKKEVTLEAKLVRNKAN